MVPLPSTRHPLLRRYVRQPWTAAARHSPTLRKWCSDHGYLTPHYAISEMADTETHELPRDPTIRANARRHCFNLERLRHALGDVPIPIDGPYRTRAHNARIHGAVNSRHTHGDATDHFTSTIDVIVKKSPRVSTRGQVVTMAEKIFPGVGNETSGTLHLDSRPGPWVRFVTWAGV